MLELMTELEESAGLVMESLPKNNGIISDSNCKFLENLIVVRMEASNFVFTLLMMIGH